MSDEEICATCLVIDVRMIRITEQIRNIYLEITGLQVTENASTPCYVCYLCHAHIKKFNKFKKKCLASQKIVNLINLSKGKITKEAIKGLDRTFFGLEPHLKYEKCSNTLVQSFVYFSEDEGRIDDDPLATIKIEQEIDEQCLLGQAISLEEVKIENEFIYIEPAKLSCSVFENNKQAMNFGINEEDEIVPVEEERQVAHKCVTDESDDDNVESNCQDNEIESVETNKKLDTKKDNKHIDKKNSVEILENLLKESLETAPLLAYKGRSLGNDSARNLVATVVANKILTDNKSRISGVIYYKWAHLIQALFPGERTTTYYIPACTTANGINHQARGKLVNQVLNKRRKLQSLGALPVNEERQTRLECDTDDSDDDNEERNYPDSEIKSVVETNKKLKIKKVDLLKKALVERKKDVDILENLLKKSLESASLLAFKGGSLSGDSARNLLSSVVARKILTDNKSPISGAIYYKWAKIIKVLFPGERITTYYIPACTTAKGTTVQARGKLVSHVSNKRKKLQFLGALPMSKKKRANSLTSSTNRPPPRPLPELLSNQVDDASVDDDLRWLSNSSDPWSLVEEKWGRTIKKRTSILYDSNNTLNIEQYFNNYPALTEPLGYFLLVKDFNYVHSAYKDNLFIHFPILKKKLFELLKSKKTNDPFHHLLITLFSSSDEETSNIAGFLTIPFLLNTASVKQNRNRGQVSHRWKPSKTEVRDGFIKHIHSSAEINQAVELRLTTLQKNGSTSQPYIIIVGEELHKIDNYLVIVNSAVFYETKSIIEAVDTCYKIVWALNVDYGVDTYPVWYFIQKGIYKMTSPFDKGSIAAESLLTDCDIN